MAVDEYAEITEVVSRVELEGIEVPVLNDWKAAGIGALLLRTESGARYLIEDRPEAPSLVTRFAEAGPLLDYDGPRTKVLIVRYEGNPDSHLELGKMMNVLGLSRRGPDFDPDSIYTTTPLTSIKFLPTP